MLAMCFQNRKIYLRNKAAVVNEKKQTNRRFYYNGMVERIFEEWNVVFEVGWEVGKEGGGGNWREGGATSAVSIVFRIDISSTSNL